MYIESFEKLPLEEVATILDRIGSMLDGAQFDPLETTIMASDLPFYPGCRLLDISCTSSIPVQKRFIVLGEKKSTVLNFTNESIYDFNQKLPIKLDPENIAAYVQFFFTFVRGKGGRFITVESVEDIPWKEDPPPSARQAIGRMIKPITLIKEGGGKTPYALQGHLVFKDSLFKADIEVAANGNVSMKNEEILVEDIPVLDDLFGQ